MRDLLITALVFASLPFILKYAYIGVYVWSWLSYMNPHRLTWGFAYTMPFAQIVALTLMVSILFDKGKKHLPKNSLMTIWVIYLVWMAITTALAFNSDSATTQLIKIYKIQLITLLTVLLIDEQKKLDWLIWVIALSIGYFSVKGGLFTLLTGGGYRVYGPPASYIEENNTLAVAVLMVIPMMIYLYRISTIKWVKWGLAVAALLSFASAFGSQSRGALLAIAAVGFFFWMKSKSKFVTGFLIVFVIASGWSFMPSSWHARMDTIVNYEQDLSAMGRLNAWGYAINVANDRITGAGLQSWSAETFAIYAPDPLMFHVAHSIYFSVLADHGWIGLIMFLSIFYLAWHYLSVVIRRTKGLEKYAQQNFLARMIQVSLVAYLSGGAFLSLSYFDLPWHFVAMALILNQMTIGVVEEEKKQFAPVYRE